MNIRVETAGACRKAVYIEVPADEVGKEFDEVLTAYARGARVPGFRPGKAPRDLIKKRFSKEIVQEVKDRLIPRGYQEAVKKEKLETVAVLDVKDQAVESGQPFAFTVMLDVAPDFRVPEYKGIAIEGRKVEVAESDVDSTIARLQDQAGRYEDVTGRAVQKSDLVQVDYEGVVDGQPVETIAPRAAGLGKGKDFWLIADNENSFLPGFADGLLGAAIGEKRQVLVDFPPDFAEAALAGKKATYFVDVKGLREKKIAVIDEAFLKSLAVDSAEALRTRVKTELEQMREGSERRRQLGEVVKYLLGNTVLDVPESVLAQETKSEVYEIVQQNTYSGASKEDIEGKKEEIFDAATKSATEKVKLRYILRRIAAQEKVETTKKEMDERIERMAEQYRVPADKFKADLHERQALGKIEEEIRLNKTLDLLLSQAKVTVK